MKENNYNLTVEEAKVLKSVLLDKALKLTYRCKSLLSPDQLTELDIMNKQIDKLSKLIKSFK